MKRSRGSGSDNDVLAKERVMLGAAKIVADLDAKVARLEAEKTEAIDALRGLYDEQNGPPVARRVKQWQAAVSKAEAVLLKYEPASDR
jgi:hypothetical protein